MTSRRPMPRSFSANGRTSSFSEEENSLSNGRPEQGRSTYLSNVRPENRSTLCTVMAQLTEDIQPSFDSTLKSKAVSENCNVKFTCVVSGYPAPDLKWYKDDMEIDRYCGLPKYEVRRNGKTHSLHIYNCTLDDAAIYQASASNSKGIVSCSGVLEVGTMSEYMIHQKFFAKLKQKAENKKRELEESKKVDKENVQQEQRKRPIPSKEEPSVLSTGVEEAAAPVTSSDNNVDKTAKKKIKIANGVEAGLSSSSSSNNRIHMMGNGGENSYDGGIGLAQFLAEKNTLSRGEKPKEMDTSEEKKTLSNVEKPKEMDTSEEKKTLSNVEKPPEKDTSEEKKTLSNVEKPPVKDTSEEKKTLSNVEKPPEKDTFEEKKTLSNVEKPKEMDASIVDASNKEEREQERKGKERDAKGRENSLAKVHEGREKELEIERENDNKRLSEASQSNALGLDGKKDGKPHKDHDHHHIQASISSVLHSVKDFFFGKNKKDVHDHKIHEDREVDHPFSPVQPQILKPETPPIPERKRKISKALAQDVPMELGQAREISNTVVTEQQVLPLTPQERVARILYRDFTPAHQEPQESIAYSTQQGPEDATEAVEPMDVSVEVDRPALVKAVAIPGAPASKEVAQDSQNIPIIQVVSAPEAIPTVLMVSPGPDHNATTEETTTRGLPGSINSPNENLTGTLHKKEIHINDLGSDLETQVNQYPSPLRKEENDEVKSKVQPCPNINITGFDEWRIENNNNDKERTETCDSKSPIQVPVILIMDENTTAPDSAKNENFKAEMESGQLTQGMNAEFSATVFPERLEYDGLKTCTPVAVGNIDDHDLNGEKNSTSALEGNDVFTSSLDSDLDINSLKIPDQALSEVESSEGKSDSLQGNYRQTLTIDREFETEKQRLTQIKAEDLGESKNGSETQCKGGSVCRSEEPTMVTNQDGRERDLDGPTENVPEIKVFTSAIADIPDIKVIAPEVRVNDQIIIPQIEIMEPDSEVVECVLPLTNQPDSGPFISQREDATDMQDRRVSEHNMAISPMTEGIRPAQKSLPNEDKLPQMEKVQDIAQVDDKIEIHNGEEPNTRPGEKVIQRDYSTLPIINVSFTDDSNFGDDIPVHVHINPPVLDTPQTDEVPKMPLFVIPPISITCNDSPPQTVKLPTQIEYTQTQDHYGILQGVVHDLETNITRLESDETHKKEQHREAITENVIENRPSVGSRVQMPTETTPDVFTLVKTTENTVVKETGMDKPITESKTYPDTTTEELHRDKPSVNRLGFKTPTPPSLSPASLRRFLFQTAPGSDTQAAPSVPAITVGDSQGDKTGEELSGGSTPTSSLSCESSPRLKRSDSLSLIRSATPEELASGARRKIFVPKSKGEEGEGIAIGVGALEKEAPYMSPGQARRAALLQAPVGTLESQGIKEAPYMSPGQARRAALLQAPVSTLESQGIKEAPYMSPSLARRAALLQAPVGSLESPDIKEDPYMSPSQARRAALLQAPVGTLESQGKKETPYMSPSQARRAALLQTPPTPPMERRSPLLSRRKATLEVPAVVKEAPKEEPDTKPEEKQKLDPFKAPQVIRKIRGEAFPDASGHLKLWCQFFNVLSDCTIKWYRDEEEILEVKRSGGDESQVALAIVQASSLDCAVYGCTITNEYGTDTTDFLLSVDIMSEILLKDDLEVGEEIEMIPMIFTKGLADSGSWGERFFGRIMTEVTQIGDGCAHKASKVKVIYGLDPVFESGSTCIIKIKNPISYGTNEGNSLAERNQEITKQECKVQNLIREYCKIFAAEARVPENFGSGLEVIPKYLMYRPANSVPYATVESELDDVFLKYCLMDAKGRLVTRTISEVEQKCCTFQHWLHQWTHGNLLVTQLEGVGGKLTNIRVVTKSKGYQGLTEEGSPKVIEQFLSHHQCNYYCGLLGLRPLKTMDSLQQPSKAKGSRSPMLNRKSTGSNSPLLQKKGTSPQIPRKAGSSPKVVRKAQPTEDNKSDTKPTNNITLDVVQIR